MKYLNEFLESINVFSCNKYPEYEDWRRHREHQDRYMPYLFSFHLTAYINGFYQIISPLSGAQLTSTNTVVTRGGGHNLAKRGNTGLFILWCFCDVDGTDILVGTMDVFSWWTHLLIPSKNICKLLVKTDDVEWFRPPISLQLFSLELEKRLDCSIRAVPVNCRKVFMGTSESAGHAVWNDLSGLQTYYRQSAFRGLELLGIRLSYSLLSSAISNSEVNEILGIRKIADYRDVNIAEEPLLLVGTVFKPLDFVLNVNNLKKSVMALRHLRKTNISHSSGDFLAPDHCIGSNKNDLSKSKVLIWANIRSPLETKRGVCANYAQLLSDAATHLRVKHRVKNINLIIDGWTGNTDLDLYTSPVQEQHYELTNALEESCLKSFDNITKITGSSIVNKIIHACGCSDIRIISICQYGSGAIYSSVIANDIAIVMDRTPFKSIGAGNDSLLGRVDNVRDCNLRLACIKSIQGFINLDLTEVYEKVLNSLIICNDLKDNLYVIPTRALLFALDKCIYMKEENRFTYIDANDYIDE